MKKIYWLFGCLVLLTFSGCDKDDEDTITPTQTPKPAPAPSQPPPYTPPDYGG